MEIGKKVFYGCYAVYTKGFMGEEDFPIAVFMDYMQAEKFVSQSKNYYVVEINKEFII